MKRVLCLAAAAALPALACVTTPPSEPRFSAPVVAKLDAALKQTKDELGLPGIYAGLWVKGVGSWEGSLGTSDPQNPSAGPITRDMRLRIGSITKTMTVTIILRLVDQGLLELDAPVAKYVPGVPNGDKITIRMLGNMTSGLASYTFDPGFQERLFKAPSTPWTPQQLVDIGFADSRAGCKNQPDAPHGPGTRACFEPGAGFFYCNTNTVLLALVAEAVSRKPYRQLLEEYVTSAYGLKNTYQPQDGELPPPSVRGASPQGRNAPTDPLVDATNWNPSWGYGVGDVVSTVEDLRVYGRALGSGALLSEASRSARFTKGTNPPNSADYAYALGIGFNHGWWGHGGEVPGYNTAVYYRPDVDAVLVVTVNRDLVDAGGKEIHPAYVMADRLVEIGAEEAPLGDYDPVAPNRELR